MSSASSTENPAGEAAVTAVEVEDPLFVGGSYVLVQKYLHDLASWDAKPVEERESVIGRLKLSDIELPDEVKPSNSHVALNTILDDNGEERQRVVKASTGRISLARPEAPAP